MPELDLLYAIIFSILPALGLLYIIYLYDQNKPEPLRLLVIAFGFGILSVIPALIVGIFLLPITPRSDIWIYIIFTSFVSAGLVEELSKYIALRISVWRHNDFNEYLDGIVYTVAIGLGFAAIENLFYYDSTSEIIVLIFRAVTSVPAHGILGVFMGYFLAIRKLDGSLFSLIFGVVGAIIFHGIYDVFAFGMVLNILFIIPLIIFLILGTILSWILIKKAQKKGPTNI